MEKELAQSASTCIKVVLFGPESTGKTTLSKLLAKHYDTLWVPEYARGYLQLKWNNTKKSCEPHDILPIATGQMRLENDLAKRTDSVLICDTDLLETKVYSEEYYGGYSHPLLSKYALENSYNMYFLTNIDAPWQQDDLRDKPREREHMFRAFEDALKNNKRPYSVLKGNVEERMAVATRIIDELLKA